MTTTPARPEAVETRRRTRDSHLSGPGPAVEDHGTVRPLDQHGKSPLLVGVVPDDEARSEWFHRNVTPSGRPPRTPMTPADTEANGATTLDLEPFQDVEWSGRRPDGVATFGSTERARFGPEPR